jgi:hypothetical protein
MPADLGMSRALSFQADEIRMCPEPKLTAAENLITNRQGADSCADVFDLSGQLAAEDAPLRPAWSGDEAVEDERLRATKRAVRPADDSCVDLDQDLIVPRHRLLDLFHPQNRWRSIPVMHNRSHRLTQAGWRESGR